MTRMYDGDFRGPLYIVYQKGLPLVQVDIIFLTVQTLKCKYVYHETPLSR